MLFRSAKQAFKKGFLEASPVLLEPIASLKVVVPDKYTGDIMGDLNKRRGRVLGMNPTDHGYQEIVAITQENIKEYEEFLERSMSDSRDEVASVKNYIYQHYAEDLSLETLAEKLYLSSGYLSFIFKKETGMNLNRFIRVVRMEKAKELLCNSNMKVAQVSGRIPERNKNIFLSDRKSTRLNSSHTTVSRMPSSA